MREKFFVSKLEIFLNKENKRISAVIPKGDTFNYQLKKLLTEKKEHGSKLFGNRTLNIGELYIKKADFSVASLYETDIKFFVEIIIDKDEKIFKNDGNIFLYNLSFNCKLKLHKIDNDEKNVICSSVKVDIDIGSIDSKEVNNMLL